jgi:hypothetical protein
LFSHKRGSLGNGPRLVKEGATYGRFLQRQFMRSCSGRSAWRAQNRGSWWRTVRVQRRRVCRCSRVEPLLLEGRFGSGKTRPQPRQDARACSGDGFWGAKEGLRCASTARECQRSTERERTASPRRMRRVGAEMRGPMSTGIAAILSRQGGHLSLPAPRTPTSATSADVPAVPFRLLVGHGPPVMKSKTSSARPLGSSMGLGPAIPVVL